MGIFSPKQPGYTPPLNGAKSDSTLLGRLDTSSIPPETESQYAEQLGATTLPPPAEGTWKIQLREYRITGHRSHAALVLIGPDGLSTEAELNGLANSRNFGKDKFGQTKFFDSLPMGPDGSKLIAHSHAGPTNLGANWETAIDVAKGSYDDIVRGTRLRGIRAADRINRLDFDYKAHDPAYEFGGNGGEIQNSNSVAYTLGRAMGLDLDGAVRNAGRERKFSGWGRDLLDPEYKRYTAPPQLPNNSAP
jgi:hypothetical protein